jgi:hypothetical protein
VQYVEADMVVELSCLYVSIHMQSSLEVLLAAISSAREPPKTAPMPLEKGKPCRRDDDPWVTP